MPDGTGKAKTLIDALRSVPPLRILAVDIMQYYRQNPDMFRAETFLAFGPELEAAEQQLHHLKNNTDGLAYKIKNLPPTDTPFTPPGF